MDLTILDLFKHYLNLQPSESQLMNSIISIPWSIKLFYGLISDNFPVFGSKRRSYLIINAILSICCIAPLIPESLDLHKYAIVSLLTVYAISVAFNDVIMDAMMVA